MHLLTIEGGYVAAMQWSQYLSCRAHMHLSSIGLSNKAIELAIATVLPTYSAFLK